MSTTDVLASLSGMAFMFAFGFAWGLTAFRKPIRARTCGTCKYFLRREEMSIAEGICARHPYPPRARVEGDDPILRPTLRPVIQLDWLGCGDSEEK